MKNARLTITITLFLVLFSSFFSYSTGVASANETLLKISPTLFTIYAKPPADVWFPFTIKNQSDQPVDLTVGYKPFNPQASSNGTITFLQNGQQISGPDKKIFDKIQIVDDNNISQDTIALGPKQTERLRLHIMVQNNELPSDYYFSLIFLQKPEKIDQSSTKNSKGGQDSMSTLQTGIATNILLAIGEKEAPLASITTFSTPFLRENGPVPFNLTVSNNGTHFIEPRGEIFIKNMFGQTIGKVNIPPTIILAGTNRTFGSKLFWDYAKSSFNASDSDSTGFLPEILWPKSFLLGMYTATLYLSLSENGPLYARSINFFVFPLESLVLLIGLFLLGLLVYSRLKKKLKE